MSENLDKALKHLSIEEEDEPFVLPDRPEFYATERNSMSLIGRLLNPHCQKMGDLILDMPRKWQLYNRVRGVALGVHTSQNWSIVLDRRMEKPPEDYLKFIMVWVQMRNIPVNHYTPETSEAMGEFAGHVVEVPFDPEKAQVKDYVRVLVRFDVSKPLRRSKKLTLPGGEVVNILYDYERIQKRCYTCQRLTHEQSMCPWRNVDKEATVGVSCSSAESKNTEVLNCLEESDPLFGVLSSKYLGLDPVSGRPKIAKEVIDGQKVFLRLESAPILSSLDKGKGAVYDFSSQEEPQPRQEKLIASAIVAGSKILQSGKVVSPAQVPKEYEVFAQSGFLVEDSTGYSVGSSDTSTSGTLLKKPKQRKRPGTYTRKAAGKRIVKASSVSVERVGEGVISDGKRKALDDVEPSKSSARFKKPLLGYDRIIAVNPIGYSRGLALMWKNSVNIGFKFVDKNLVDFSVKFVKDSFFVSCVYGEPIQGNRTKVWERLSRIGAHRKEPWCMLGDFNEIRNNGEKIGGPRRGEASFQDFNDMLDIGEMVELQSSGDNLTWGGKLGDSWIRSRLDRCFGNKQWMKLFPASNQAFLDKRGSDDRPVLVRLASSSEPFRGSFRFDRRFLNNSGVKDEIKKAWLTNHPFFEAKVSDKLKRCRKALSKWKKGKSKLQRQDQTDSSGFRG
ncbi:PREDICTED: uncharacterized protein LOC106319692 [Brassica oleracea var. oleracea]|uniref:uncharacterized protein LOC106319692 n=1 Tax=Brassica oleracea var. oleracea TaxID=109376 RepID=UPI0006A6E395|nr:PREDICTED: uncharacterized protein LOC106319692 [Brassica oleracea var. oleracea]